MVMVITPCLLLQNAAGQVEHPVQFWIGRTLKSGSIFGRHQQSLFDWAPFRSTKSAIKLHTLLDLRGAILTFIYISDGKLHDVNVLDILPLEAGAFFVTRAKKNMDARRVYSAPTQRDTGVMCDQRVMLNGFYVAKTIQSICDAFDSWTRSRERHSSS
jgi:hypothetical protein